MASKSTKQTKKASKSYFDRQLQRNRVIFIVISVILVLSLALSAVINL